METPLERAEHAVECLIGTNCESCEAPLPSDAADIVRAVLRAIREPSEAMVQAGGQLLMDDESPEPPLLLAEAVLQAMIDAALNEQPPNRIPASDWMKTPSAR